ncbi:L-fuculose phosphate aldolase [Pirellulimonas nuda]|uniref:3-oxo-tetronate 4-phosphate decarboxylase n=1 Tax=Pirellulimonas nuda TaxID=2528009 RepID=A0A518DJM1_9BACT|nr:3-oxo-tetronate 4-phosphate decarboxylase [Pirellulimonas nuda]QDU91678.1 L-fuculose phosphate aldolase [Pirellulimonas nuda]
MNYREQRQAIAHHAKSLFDRGYGCGSSGNISLRVDEGMLITPTNSCMGTLDPAKIALVDHDGKVLDGDKPSKELFLHQAMYGRRPDERAIVHLHSTWSVAVSCLADVNPDDVLPALTAYYVMRVGSLPLAPYFPPGDLALAEAVATLAQRSRAVLLANHGPVVAGAGLEQAVYAAEELEETAKLFLLLRGQPIRPLTEAQVADLRVRFPT